MSQLKSLLSNLRPADLAVILFGLFLSIINLIFNRKIDNWLIHILLNFSVIFMIFLIAYFDKHKSSLFFKHLHYWYFVPLIFLSFKQIYFMLRPIHPADYDNILIAIDRFIFGTDPTIWLWQYSHPLLTELLQIVYATFFFLPIILGINLLWQNREKEFHFTTFSIVFGFFLSYIGYFLVPAIGPRFTLHEFSLTNQELPGLFLTNYLREIVNAGESIPSGTLNPALIVQRDVFPSGHTQMTLIVMYLSLKFKVATRYFFIPNGSLLIFSTVYLRYHYVIDLFGGLVFMIITMVLGKIFYNWWMKITNGQPFEYERRIN